TLLSSQTTDTTGTTHTHQGPGSLRSNFSNLPDQPELRKSTFPRFPVQSPAPPDTSTPGSAPFFRLLSKGFGLRGSQLQAVSLAATQKTLHAHGHRHKSPPTPTKTRANTGQKDAQTPQTKHNPPKTTQVKPITNPNDPKPHSRNPGDVREDPPRNPWGPERGSAPNPGGRERGSGPNPGGSERAINPNPGGSARALGRGGGIRQRAPKTRTTKRTKEDPRPAANPTPGK
ncbi:hypothetical protein J2790_004119, partial [Paenarthrobacter nicotinovorans]|nr:hypothetical protein [Paenarthrobacter nicotinovorans]